MSTLVARLYPGIFFLLFGGLTILSNNFDWDFFFTTLEVDLRSWFIDGKLPLWSYQFCGGVTRWGDPQSFGLSPFFLIVALFGSFWGAKILWVLSSIVGLIYHRKILELFILKEKKSYATALSVLFVFSNHFLWRAHVGHLSFSMHYWVLIPVYCIFKSIFGSLKKSDVVIGAFALYAVLSGGFYHSVLFFLLPLYLALLITLIVLAAVPKWRPQSFSFRRFGALAVGLHVVGVALATYKIYGVFSYQLTLPRTLDGQYRESISLLRTLAYQLIPTFDLEAPMAPFNKKGRDAVWEYSAFSPMAWLLLAALFIARKNLLQLARTLPAALFVFVIAYSLTALSFSTGDSGFMSLHQLINDHLLNGSARSAGRYQIGISFLVSILAAIALWQVHELNRSTARRLTIAALAIAMANFVTFAPRIDVVRLKEILSYPDLAMAEMNQLVFVEPISQMTSHMYEPTRLGSGVLNCYMPMARDIALGPETTHTGGLLPFLDIPNAATAEACRNDSHFTQNDLFISAACPSGTCVNLNGVNMYKLSALRYDVTKRKFCLP